MLKTTRRFCLCLSILCLLCLSSGALAMRLDNLMLCSTIEGQLLDHGKPAPGLKIERRLKWSMEKTPRTDYAFTDAEGRFTLPEVRGGADFGWLSKYLHVPSVGIRIRLFEGDAKSDLAYFTRNSYQPSVEIGVQIIKMRCDLADRMLVDQAFPIVECRLNKQVPASFSD